VQYQIGTLGGSALGLTVLGAPLVTLDATAAGYGWFVDANPVDSPALGRMDLLTVVGHELGHVLGLADVDPQVAPNDLLTTTLDPGVRRLPLPSGDPVTLGIMESSQAPPAAPAQETAAASLNPAASAQAPTARPGTIDEMLLLPSYVPAKVFPSSVSPCPRQSPTHPRAGRCLIPSPSPAWLPRTTEAACPSCR
jgi:hypothetical protein